MAIPVEMPKMSDTMEEGVLVAWLAEEGDAVSAGDVIAQVETDKATMDLEVYDDGVLLKRVIGEGDAVPIGALIAVLGEEGEDVSQILEQYGGGDGTAQETEAKEEAAGEQEAPEAPADVDTEHEAETEEAGASGDGAATVPGYGTPGATKTATEKTATGRAAAPAGDGDGRLKASPLARKLASDHGIDLTTLQGSGPEGRIVKRDIEAALSEEASAEVAVEAKEEAPAPKPVSREVAVADEAQYESTRLSQMRKAIARRLAQSKFTAPHFYLTVELEMENAAAFRQQLNELAEAQDRLKVSYNDLITKACAMALRRHPQVNASYMEEEGEIRTYKAVHMGVAVAIDEGLVTPVIRNADQKGLGQIAEETRALAERARDRKLQPGEMAGSTFTTSNLGMFGIDEFTAIINPPNACILAIGAIREVPVVKDSEVVPGKRMKVTLSCDHRVVDGATGAQFLATVRQYIEEPLNLML